jgi:hypothetical protein
MRAIFGRDIFDSLQQSGPAELKFGALAPIRAALQGYTIDFFEKIPGIRFVWNFRFLSFPFDDLMAYKSFTDYHSFVAGFKHLSIEIDHCDPILEHERLKQSD